MLVPTVFSSDCAISSQEQQPDKLNGFQYLLRTPSRVLVTSKIADFKIFLSIFIGWNIVEAAQVKF